MLQKPSPNGVVGGLSRNENEFRLEVDFIKLLPVGGKELVFPFFSYHFFYFYNNIHSKLNHNKRTVIIHVNNGWFTASRQVVAQGKE